MHHTEGLSRALEGAGPVVVYTDVSRFRLWAGSQTETLDAHCRALVEAAVSRPLLFPTFNYDWCRTGTFDPATDPAQVGVLNEHFRRHYADWRSRTPVFNFAGIGQVHDSLIEPNLLAFGVTSMFGWLIDVGATVVAYGAPLHRASALHHTEQRAHAPYRYLKKFPGHIRGHGEFSLLYNVGPPFGLKYDWGAVDAVLRPVFTEHDVGCGTVHVSTADAIDAALRTALEQGEHAFLKEPPHELYFRCGRPLRYESVEAVAA